MAKPEMYPVESHDVTTYYVWDGFVRTSHWINVVAVAVLIFTGFAIGSPSCRPPLEDPLQGMPMATAKNLHFLAAVVFTLNGLARMYWFFAGKTYRQWFRFHIWRLDFWKEAWWKLKEYVTLRYEDYELHTLGHNTLASLAYVLVFLVAAGDLALPVEQEGFDVCTIRAARQDGAEDVGIAAAGVIRNHFERGAGDILGHFLVGWVDQPGKGKRLGDGDDIGFFGQGLFDQPGHALAVGRDGWAVLSGKSKGDNAYVSRHRLPLVSTHQECE